MATNKNTGIVNEAHAEIATALGWLADGSESASFCQAVLVDAGIDEQTAAAMLGRVKLGKLTPAQALAALVSPQEEEETTAKPAAPRLKRIGKPAGKAKAKPAAKPAGKSAARARKASAKASEAKAFPVTLKALAASDKYPTRMFYLGRGYKSAGIAEPTLRLLLSHDPAELRAWMDSVGPGEETLELGEA